MPNRLFTPSEHHFPSEKRVDSAADICDVLALVTLHAERQTKELVIGLDAGRVIRVVATRQLPARARAQLEFHERAQPRISIHADELYLMDVQAVERLPDTPGADDPLFLYGVLRGPYPDALVDGVYGIEGQLATTRGPLLDGLATGIDRAFVYQSGRCGTTCTHAALPVDVSATSRSLVLAFPLAPMGDDGSNELVAAQLITEVLGAMRTDLGDDLANDPVPVPNRAQYERDLTDAGWVIDAKNQIAIHRGGKGRFASLFAPARKQKLPHEIKLADYVSLVTDHVKRLPGWPDPERKRLHEMLGLVAPAGARPPKAQPQGSFEVRGRPPTRPPPLPPRARRPSSQPPTPAPRQRPPTNPKQPRTVMPGLTAPGRKDWIKQMAEGHDKPGRRRPRVADPGHVTGAPIPDWMFDFDESDD